MVKDAEANKAEDDKRKEQVELKNKAESFIAQIDQSLNEQNANVSEQQKQEVEKLKAELQKAIDENDYDTLKTKLDELEKAAQMMSEAMYKAQAEQAQASQNQSQDNQEVKNDDVVDADFKAKD